MKNFLQRRAQKFFASITVNVAEKFFALLTVCALTVTGCGSEKIIGTPDKAVLAYAEIAMTGASDNMQAAGFTDTDAKEIRFNVANTFVDSMKSIAPLSNETAEQVTDMYFDKLKGALKFNVTLVKDNSERPVVEITTTPIDQSETARTAAVKNDELLALIGMVGKLKSEGADDNALKENPDVQKLAANALQKYIDNIQFAPEKTFSVTCTKVTGSDGNIHWAPVNNDAFVSFLTGQK